MSRSPCAPGISTTSSPRRPLPGFGRPSSWRPGSTPAPTDCDWPAGTVVYEIDQPAGDRVQDPHPRRPRRGPDGRPPDRRHRPARRLAGGTAGRRFRSDAAHRVDRRRAAGVPAARRAGSAVRQHHRAVRAGQPAGHRAHGPAVACRRTGPNKLAERTRRIGSDINLAELFYSGERNPPATIWRRMAGRSRVRSTLDAFAANGFELPDDELAAFAGAIRLSHRRTRVGAHDGTHRTTTPGIWPPASAPPRPWSPRAGRSRAPIRAA